MEELTFVVEQLERLGLTLTEKAIEAISFLWPLAIKQVVIDALSYFILFAVAALLCFFGTWKLKQTPRSVRDETERLGAIIVCAGLGLMFTAFSISSMLRLLNLKWHAISELAKMLKGG